MRQACRCLSACITPQTVAHLEAVDVAYIQERAYHVLRAADKDSLWRQYVKHFATKCAEISNEALFWFASGFARVIREYYDDKYIDSDTEYYSDSEEWEVEEEEEEEPCYVYKGLQWLEKARLTPWHKLLNKCVHVIVKISV